MLSSEQMVLLESDPGRALYRSANRQRAARLGRRRSARSVYVLRGSILHSFSCTSKRHGRKKTCRYQRHL
jgi:hypothetical protein